MSPAVILIVDKGSHKWTAVLKVNGWRGAWAMLCHTTGQEKRKKAVQCASLLFLPTSYCCSPPFCLLTLTLCLLVPCCQQGNAGWRERREVCRSICPQPWKSNSQSEKKGKKKKKKIYQGIEKTGRVFVVVSSIFWKNHLVKWWTSSYFQIMARWKILRNQYSKYNFYISHRLNAKSCV